MINGLMTLQRESLSLTKCIELMVCLGFTKDLGILFWVRCVTMHSVRCLIALLDGLILEAGSYWACLMGFLSIALQS